MYGLLNEMIAVTPCGNSTENKTSQFAVESIKCVCVRVSLLLLAVCLVCLSPLEVYRIETNVFNSIIILIFVFASEAFHRTTKRTTERY